MAILKNKYGFRIRYLYYYEKEYYVENLYWECLHYRSKTRKVRSKNPVNFSPIRFVVIQEQEEIEIIKRALAIHMKEKYK